MSYDERKRLQNIYIQVASQEALETNMSISTTDDILDVLEDVRRTALQMEDGELIRFANRNCFNGKAVVA